MDSLAISERQELQQHERVIQQGLNTFVEVGQALAAIRDSRLYREDYGTFEDYLRERWGMERRHAYRLIDAAEAVNNVSNWTQISPATESQARPLTKLEPAEQVRAWELVISTAPEGKITAAHVLEAAKVIQAERREEKRAERVEIITHETQDIKNVGRFNIVYADPPWRYEHSISTSRDIENQYPTMELEDICALSVGDISMPDSVLFLWATSPKLSEAMKVMEAWGFTYKTCMVWVKDKIGMGYYARQQHEILLIGSRGNLPTPEPANRPSSIIYGDRLQHSSKPENVYATIEKMYPEYNKVELFCRNARNGWSTWGNQS